MLPVTRINNADMWRRLLGDKMRRTADCVTHHKHIDKHRFQIAYGIEQAFTFGC